MSVEHKIPELIAPSWQSFTSLDYAGMGNIVRDLDLESLSEE
jgi:hypothetical protein